MLRNGVRQSLQFFFVEVLPGLIRVGFYLIDRQELIGAVFLGFFHEIPQQSAQALAQSFV